LKAFLHVYAGATAHLQALSLGWNDATTVDWSTIWPAFAADMPEIAEKAVDWQRQMLANGDLSSNLLKFVDTVK